MREHPADLTQVMRNLAENSGHYHFKSFFESDPKEFLKNLDTFFAPAQLNKKTQNKKRKRAEESKS
jgi:hypothetical protein